MHSFKFSFRVMKISIFPGTHLALFLRQFYDFQVIVYLCVMSWIEKFEREEMQSFH